MLLCLSLCFKNISVNRRNVRTDRTKYGHPTIPQRYEPYRNRVFPLPTSFTKIGNIPEQSKKGKRGTLSGIIETTANRSHSSPGNLSWSGFYPAERLLPKTLAITNRQSHKDKLSGKSRQLVKIAVKRYSYKKTYKKAVLSDLSNNNTEYPPDKTND